MNYAKFLVSIYIPLSYIIGLKQYSFTKQQEIFKEVEQ